MKIKCDYCGNTYEEFQTNCPSCGASNPSHHDGDKQPQTIEELKKWYQDRHLPPPEITRFFIGINYKEPKAFGICKDENGEFVVYKNKADGTRAVRYKGKDEAYAVDELYQKLKDEIVHQKNNSRKKQQNQAQRVANDIKDGILYFIEYISWYVLHMALWVVICTLLINVLGLPSKYTGYYHYNDTYYYNDAGTWYSYDDDWYVTTPPIEYDKNNTDPYYMGRNFNDIEWEISDKDFILSGDGNTKAFTDATKSTCYQKHQSYSYDSDYDSDYDWDWGSDSWDSGGTDWGSDW